MKLFDSTWNHENWISVISFVIWTFVIFSYFLLYFVIWTFAILLYFALQILVKWLILTEMMKIKTDFDSYIIFTMVILSYTMLANLFPVMSTANGRLVR